MIHQFTQGFRFIGITMSISALQGKLVTNSHLTCDILQSTLEASIIDNPTLSQFFGIYLVFTKVFTAEGYPHKTI